jgi:hypothetical protein
MMKRCCSRTAFARSASSTVMMPAEIARLKIPGVFNKRPAPSRARVSRRNFFVRGDEPLSALRQAQACRLSGAQDLDEIRIHFQFRWVRELHFQQQP